MIPAMVQLLSQQDPDLVYFMGTTGQLGRFLSDLRKIDFVPKAVSVRTPNTLPLNQTQYWLYPVLVGNEMRHSIYNDTWYIPSSPTESSYYRMQRLFTFQSPWNANPVDPYYACQSITALSILHQAIVKAQSDNVAVVKQFLGNSTFISMLGTMSFSSLGESQTRHPVIQRVQLNSYFQVAPSTIIHPAV